LSRKLIAGLACRITGSRLYGKPLQNIAPGVTILAQIVALIRAEQIVDEVVLAIAETPENEPLVLAAGALGCPYVRGSESDVLGRLITAAEAHGASDVLRKTTESPFFEIDGMHGAWEQHVADGNDITVVDHVPLGTAVEIYSVEALKRSHAEGKDEDRSELVSNYARYNQRLFKVGLVLPEPKLRRLDVRLTVDYPEDLVLCREIYAALADRAPSIPLADIIEFVDSRPDLKALVDPYVYDLPIWDGAPQR
jgi:spore coat polysaccharide biosynthesis protein SpsF